MGDDPLALTYLQKEQRLTYLDKEVTPLPVTSKEEQKASSERILKQNLEGEFKFV